MSMERSAATAPTQFLQMGNETYAYRRFGSGPGLPLLFLQHFTGTFDNWDPAVTDPLASGREVILFESAGLGRSTGKVPDTIAGMAKHALAFLDGLNPTHSFSTSEQTKTDFVKDPEGNLARAEM
jgi:pimeloyl-ACP methyl ester carboxylesterase